MMKLLLVVVIAIWVREAACQCSMIPTFCGPVSQSTCENTYGCCYIASNNRCYHSTDPCSNVPNACLPDATCENVGSGGWECTCPAHYPPGYNCRGTVGECSVAPAARVACGQVSGSSQAKRLQCERRGCCYNDSTPGTKWCFRPINVMLNEPFVGTTTPFVLGSSSAAPVGK